MRLWLVLRPCLRLRLDALVSALEVVVDRGVEILRAAVGARDQGQGAARASRVAPAKLS